MTVSAQIIEVLDNLCEKFGLVIDWTADNVFPYLQELCEKFISWEIATSTMWIVLGVIVLLGGIAFILGDTLTDWYFAGGFLAIGICLVIAGISVIVYQVQDILTCKYFPEKEIFDYIKVYLN